MLYSSSYECSYVRINVVCVVSWIIGCVPFMTQLLLVWHMYTCTYIRVYVQYMHTYIVYMYLCMYVSTYCMYSIYVAQYEVYVIFSQSLPSMMCQVMGYKVHTYVFTCVL